MEPIQPPARCCGKPSCLQAVQQLTHDKRIDKLQFLLSSYAGVAPEPAKRLEIRARDADAPVELCVCSAIGAKHAPGVNHVFFVVDCRTIGLAYYVSASHCHHLNLAPI